MKLWGTVSQRRKSEFLGFLLIVFALFVLLSLATRTDGDDRWIRADRSEIWLGSYYHRNLAGSVGALVSYSLYEFLGWSCWLLVLTIGAYGLKLFFSPRCKKLVLYAVGAWTGSFLIGVVVQLPAAHSGAVWPGGLHTISGVLGHRAAGIVARVLGVAGGALVISAVIAVSLYWVLPWRAAAPLWHRIAKHGKPRRRKRRVLFPRLRVWLNGAVHWLRLHWERLRSPKHGEPEDASDDWRVVEPEDSPPVDPDPMLPPGNGDQPTAEPSLPRPADPPRPRRVARVDQTISDDYEYPSLDILDSGTRHTVRRRTDGHGAEILMNALGTFGIGIDGVIESYPGPVITRYEFRPAPGVKVNQIVALADDLALALSASRVRVVAPVPGKAAVGIEIPNAEPEIVRLAEILGDGVFTESDAALPLALGKTTEGTPFVADLAAMPHLLIAGATGSGKSVCINAIITSLLFRHHPRDVRLLFIDPKMLELSMYQGIPHLERPVVTNPRAAERLLIDAVREMDDRYKALANAGVRNIADYNRKVDPANRLPYIIIIVDELADLMLSQSAAKIEMTITRLAQMARAVGIHLILATQRPSVDVITGLIKANFSCRIAFQVATKVDSRTILDGNGAEKLLGRGDMLFLSPGRPSPIRLHGAFVSSAETMALVDVLKDQAHEPEAIQNFSENGDRPDGLKDDHGDLLFHQAAEVVIRHKQGSVSLLQRRLGIGYQRAARLIDKLEEAGIVGPYDGSKAREVLWTHEDYEEKFAKAVN